MSLALRERTIVRILRRLAVRPRHIAPVALLLVLTVAGFIVARVLTERGERRESENRAQVAAAQIRGRIAQGASLTESLGRFMLDASGTGITSDEFARNALRWLSPAGFSAAAWVERVPDSRRAAYERRIGQPIVTPDARRAVVAPGSRSFYLPATLGLPHYADPAQLIPSDLPSACPVQNRAARSAASASWPAARRATFD